MAFLAADARLVGDITGDTDAVARAAGIVNGHALERIWDKAVADAEQALRQAVLIETKLSGTRPPPIRGLGQLPWRESTASARQS